MNYYYELDDANQYYLGMNHLRSEVSDNKYNGLTSVNFRLMNDNFDEEKFSFGMGFRLTHVSNDIDETFVVMPIGVHGRYNLSSKLSLNTNIYYSPEALSFFDAKKLISYDIDVNYKIINNGFIYVGSRKIDTQYDNGADIEFNKSVYFGFKFLF